MDPLELIETNGVISFWYDDQTPEEEVIVDATARAVALLARRRLESARIEIDTLKQWWML